MIFCTRLHSKHDFLWCYNNAPSVSAVHTQEHADKDKHTPKQMLAGKHSSTGKKIDEQKHRWTQTQHRRSRLRRVRETQWKAGRDNKHQHERTLVRAQIYIIAALVCSNSLNGRRAPSLTGKIKKKRKACFLSCVLGGNATVISRKCVCPG